MDNAVHMHVSCALSTFTVTEKYYNMDIIDIKHVYVHA